MNDIKKNNGANLLLVLFINFVIFGIINIIFDIKYEQVDDFIIYKLYSGLDGTYNLHGVYIHSVICFVLSLLYRMISFINWHTVFLLSMQFICFTIIGYIIINKHNNRAVVILYTVFASVIYSVLLMLIQYTSVAGLLILTSFFIVINVIEEEKLSNKKVTIFVMFLYTLGIMTRLQSVLIIIPFMILYLLISAIKYKIKKIEKDKIIRLLKYYLVYGLLTIVVWMSNSIIYNSNEVYKNYMEYNKFRTTLHDITYVSYEDNKEIFDEIGWSYNDYYMFYTFGFGDENIYSKDNLQKIIDYKKQKDGLINKNIDVIKVIQNFKSESMNYSSILFFSIFVISIFNKNKLKENVAIFLMTILVHILFIVMGRSVFRVVIPEYILGIILIIYNLKFNKNYSKGNSLKNSIMIIVCIITLGVISAGQYNYNYRLKDFKNYQELIDYTNSNKENVYLYTVPSLQFRYLAYSVYQMPPKNSFSNLRVLGGWDMYTQNYYDFNNRNGLDGNLLDLLKDNVYLIDGDVVWSGNRYYDYKENIIVALKENYNVEVECKEIKEYDNLKIYKLYEKNI